MKKVIVVTSSPRKNGNSETLANSFAEGAKAAGNEVLQVAVRDLGLQFCTGCMFCQSHDRCVLGDGMNALYSKFENADVLVFATPVYYYAVSGQLKTFLDRLNPLYPRKNKFKEVYLIATAAETAEKKRWAIMAAKWALRVTKWIENALIGIMLIWLAFLIGAVVTGTVVFLGYPI